MQSRRQRTGSTEFFRDNGRLLQSGTVKKRSVQIERDGIVVGAFLYRIGPEEDVVASLNMGLET